MEQLTNNNKGWDIPQRQSAGAMFVMLLKTAVEMIKSLWPVLIVFVLRDEESRSGNKLIMGILVFVGLTFIVTMLKYWFYKFHIADNNLVIQSGWLKKKTLSLPLQNIQEVHLQQNLLQQFLKVFTISIDSAGSEKAEVKIDALSASKAEELKMILLSQSRNDSNVTTEEVVPQKMLVRLTNAELMRFSLSANHLEAFMIIAGVGLNLMSDLKEAFRIDSWGLMKSYAAEAAGQTTLFVSFLLIAVALISVGVSVIRTLLKFYHFTMEQIPQGWKISFGLVNAQQKIIPANKIQVLSWKANWIRRKLNFWILQVQSIGYTKTKRKQLVQVPVTSLSQVLSLAPVYQQSPLMNPAEAMHIQPAYWKRKLLLTGAPSTLALAWIFYSWVGPPGLWILLLFVYLAWYFNTWYKVFRWQVNEEGLQLFSGVWGRKYSLLTWKKIQHVAIKQNPYQRSHGLANIIFFTAGGKVEVPYIEWSTANELANWSMYYVESSNEHWM